MQVENMGRVNYGPYLFDRKVNLPVEQKIVLFFLKWCQVDARVYLLASVKSSFIAINWNCALSIVDIESLLL